MLDGCLGIEPVEAVIAVGFALAKAIAWDGFIISPEFYDGPFPVCNAR